MAKSITDKAKSKTKQVLTELEKGISHIIVEIIEYVPNSVVIKTIIKKLLASVIEIRLDYFSY